MVVPIETKSETSEETPSSLPVIEYRWKDISTKTFRILLLIAVFVLQNSISVLMGRATRTNRRPEELYNINHFIVVSECSKFFLSLLLEFALEQQMSISALRRSIQIHIFDEPWDAIKKSLIPASLYLISNTLTYLALSNLTAPVFQVLYQGKLLMTTLMSVLFFKRTYSLQQWVCMSALSVGVAIVVIGEDKTKDEGNEDGGSLERQQQYKHHQNPHLGVVAIAFGCMASSLAGVYFEKILKRDQQKEVTTTNMKIRESQVEVQPQQQQPQPSLWIRNMMLAFFSLVIGVTQGFLQDQSLFGSGASFRKAYFHGFTVWVWVQVSLLAFGGLLVAGVIKYADNVIKGLATGLSVALSTALSITFFGTPLTAEFVWGSCLIVSSAFFFTYPITCSTKVRIYVVFLSGFLAVINMSSSLSLMSEESGYESSFSKPVHHVKRNDVIMPPVSSVRFHVVVPQLEPMKDCGGCLVLDLLVSMIGDLGYDVTKSVCPSIGPNDTNAVIIYPEIATGMCSSTHSKAAHVHWMLAPLGIHVDQAMALRWWKPDDMVFHYGTNSQNTTKIPVPLNNILTIAKNPHPGDDTDPNITAAYKPLERTGMGYIMRKALRFHGQDLYSLDGKLPHENLGFIAKEIPKRNLENGINSSKLIMGYEYFLSYDPYSFWSMKAAMLGVVSIVYPVKGLTKEEWVDGFYIGAYLREHNLPLNMPGVAYGLTQSELDYARNTLHEMRPLLLKVNEWGNSTVRRLIRDCDKWLKGERENFEGAVLSQSYFPVEMMMEEKTKCNWSCYIKNYPDLQKAFGGLNKIELLTAAEQHYKTHGREEQRFCGCMRIY